MARPTFTLDEEYIILYARTHADGFWDPFAAGYLAGGFLLCGWGIGTEMEAMVHTGVLLIIAFRFYEMFRQRKWGVVWRNVIEKYEEAISGQATNELRSGPC